MAVKPFIRCESGANINVDEIKFLGEVTIGNVTYNVNVSSILPNYADLTVDNFFFSAKSALGGSNAGNTGTFELTKTYNPTTGDFSIIVGKTGANATYCHVAGYIYYTKNGLPTS